MMEKSPIGKYGVALVECDACGKRHVMAYPVPIWMPCECPYCGEFECYFAEQVKGGGDTNG